MAATRPVLLLILDGFGHRLDGDDNAVLQANTPNWDKLRATYAYGTIEASERRVGLPPGQFGNSEVGHLNIGAGRVVPQDITRIDLDIEQQTFAKNPVIANIVQQCAASGGTLQLIGLLSGGGVHSHERHFHAMIRAAHDAGVRRIRIHAFLDGRDTPPQSAGQYIERLEALCNTLPDARIASLCGRYWSMDRDKRWERVEQAWHLLIDSKAEHRAEQAMIGLQQAYQRGENDEFIKPTLIGEAYPISDGNYVFFMNFRADRTRELTSALTDPAFNAFPVKQPKLAAFASITSYGNAYHHPIAYPPQTIRNGFGEYLASQGLTQLRIAETEKYSHVTYFFNGGGETEYPGEQRIMVPSPKVATYDLQPEMSAPEVTDHVVEAINSKQFNAIICNYANGDMVGHSGVFSAAAKAVETLDQCIARCVSAMLAQGGEVLITADHGNCERMNDIINHQSHTQHTLSPVPFLYIGRQATIVPDGSLQDIAPTLLAMMGLPKPAEMTGNSLIKWA